MSAGTSLRQRVVHGVLWLTAARASGQVITWVITIVVVRLLAPEDYGLMGMATLFTGFLLLFNEIGLGTAIVQKADITPAQIAGLRWVIFGINLGLFGLVLVLAPWVAVYFDEPRLVQVVQVLATGFLMNGAGVPSAAILQREMAFKEKGTAELFGNVAGGVTTLALALLGYGVWSLVHGYLALRLVTNALYCAYRPPTRGHGFSLRSVRLFMNFGFQVAMSRILWYLSSSADIMIVGRLLGSVQLGYYSLAFQYSSLPLEKFVTILSDVALPSFSSVQADPARLRRHYLKLVNFVALVTFPMFIGLLLVADSAVPLFLGTRWLPVILPLKLLCVVSCFRAIETINAPVALASGQPRVVVMNTLAGAVVLPVSFFIGATYGGINGVAVAWLVTRPVLFAVVTWQTGRAIGLTVGRYLMGLRHPVAGSVAMVALVMFVDASVPAGVGVAVRFAAQTLVGMAAYVLYQVMFNGPEVRDVLEILHLPGAAWLPRSPFDAHAEKDSRVIASER